MYYIFGSALIAFLLIYIMADWEAKLNILSHDCLVLDEVVSWFWASQTRFTFLSYIIVIL